jgi:hypothetical protein
MNVITNVGVRSEEVFYIALDFNGPAESVMLMHDYVLPFCVNFFDVSSVRELPGVRIHFVSASAMQ